MKYKSVWRCYVEKKKTKKTKRGHNILKSYFYFFQSWTRATWEMYTAGNHHGLVNVEIAASNDTPRGCPGYVRSSRITTKDAHLCFINLVTSQTQPSPLVTKRRQKQKKNSWVNWKLERAQCDKENLNKVQFNRIIPTHTKKYDLSEHKKKDEKMRDYWVCFAQMDISVSPSLKHYRL
jgi:hypothetical protein